MVLVSIILSLCTSRTKTQIVLEYTSIFLCIVLSVSYIYSFCRKEHEKCEFETYEVYGVDVLVSTGDGKVTKMLKYGESTVLYQTLIKYFCHKIDMWLFIDKHFELFFG